MIKYSYQPPRSAREIKADELTQAVRVIVEKENAELEAKLKRLRLARAERDALHQQQLPQEAIPPGGGKVRVGKRRSTTTLPPAKEDRMRSPRLGNRIKLSSGIAMARCC